MSSPDSKPPSLIPQAVTTARSPGTFRAKSIATRLTDAEFTEVEQAAARAGKKVAEWLREIALAEARGKDEGDTDPILLAELMGIRALILNLFREGSRNPISDESLRKISAYSESVKQQKADEFLAKLRARSGAAETPENKP
ncbi:MAG: hypothetical protein WBE72_17770 [Terracidiphilus sp.]|jgi:hypothetical protein